MATTSQPPLTIHAARGEKLNTDNFGPSIAEGGGSETVDLQSATSTSFVVNGQTIIAEGGVSSSSTSDNSLPASTAIAQPATVILATTANTVITFTPVQTLSTHSSTRTSSTSSSITSTTQQSLSSTGSSVTSTTQQPLSSDTSGSAPPNQNTTTSTKSGLTSGQKAGIGVGVTFAILLLLGLLAFFIINRRRRKQAQESPSEQEVKKGGAQIIYGQKEEPRRTGARRARLGLGLASLHGTNSLRSKISSVSFPSWVIWKSPTPEEESEEQRYARERDEEKAKMKKERESGSRDRDFKWTRDRMHLLEIL